MRPARRSDASSPAPSTTRSELAELAHDVDVVTFDVENVPVDAVADDRGDEAVPAAGAGARRLAGSAAREDPVPQLKIPTPPFAPVDSLDGPAARRSRRSALPGVLKTRRLGYDGRGQFHRAHSRATSKPRGKRSAPCR